MLSLIQVNSNFSLHDKTFLNKDLTNSKSIKLSARPFLFFKNLFVSKKQN
jgi:hypothetical protein